MKEALKGDILAFKGAMIVEALDLVDRTFESLEEILTLSFLRGVLEE